MININDDEHPRYRRRRGGTSRYRDDSVRNARMTIRVEIGAPKAIMR